VEEVDWEEEVRPGSGAERDSRASIFSRVNIAMAGVLLLWIAALLSRESAVILPLFLAAFDLAFGGCGTYGSGSGPTWSWR